MEHEELSQDLPTNVQTLRQPFITASEFDEQLRTAKEWASGPHDKSNWLIRGRCIVGGWPFRLPKGRGSSGESAKMGEDKLLSILEAGVQTFASLTESGEIRGEHYCYNTFKGRAESIHAELFGPRRHAKRLGQELRFFQCPMRDGSVGGDGPLARLLEQLLKEMAEGRMLYVHCYGGHGRAGIVSCALLCIC